MSKRKIGHKKGVGAENVWNAENCFEKTRIEKTH